MSLNFSKPIIVGMSGLVPPCLPQYIRCAQIMCEIERVLMPFTMQLRSHHAS